jgi:hypothetical protein
VSTPESRRYARRNLPRPTQRFCTRCRKLKAADTLAWSASHLGFICVERCETKL